MMNNLNTEHQKESLHLRLKQQNIQQHKENQ